MSMNWVSTSSDNGLSPVRRLAVTWTNTDMFLIGLWKTNFSEIWIKMLNLSFMKMILKILSAKWRPFCPGERLENVKAASPRAQCIIASSNGNIFRYWLLCGEFTGHPWIPLTKASDAELWSFLWSAPEPTVEQTIETPVIWDAIAVIMTSL